MKRLQASRLIWGNLLPIDEAHLIERYGRAMRAFGLEMPALERFEIDMTGWSREVAEALGRRDYLDPEGVNRRFIILSPQQAQLPVVASSFSNTNELMAEFFRANARTIAALTIKDVIYGEIEDSIERVGSMEDLLAIEEVRFRVLSADDTVEKAAELRSLADRVLAEPDAWRDRPMLERMVGLAQDTGDIRRTQLVPDQLVFRHDAFWSSHFGGVYVFNDAGEGLTSSLGTPRITVIGDPGAPGFRRSRPWQVSYIDINDADRVHAFLAATDRLEPVRRDWVDASGLLAHRSAMLVRELMLQFAPDTNFDAVDARQVKRFLSRYEREIERDGRLPFLNASRREVEVRGSIDLERVRDGGLRFFLSRANPGHDDRWLVNQLITEFVPSDFVSTFVFHKPRFYERYETYPDNYRDHVVRVLEDTYVSDKRALRRRLYGFK